MKHANHHVMEKTEKESSRTFFQVKHGEPRKYFYHWMPKMSSTASKRLAEAFINFEKKMRTEKRRIKDIRRKLTHKAPLFKDVKHGNANFCWRLNHGCPNISQSLDFVLSCTLSPWYYSCKYNIGQKTN